jgi:hypothetical protein
LKETLQNPRPWWSPSMRWKIMSLPIFPPPFLFHLFSKYLSEKFPSLNPSTSSHFCPIFALDQNGVLNTKILNVEKHLDGHLDHFTSTLPYTLLSLSPSPTSHPHGGQGLHCTLAPLPGPQLDRPSLLSPSWSPPREPAREIEEISLSPPFWTFPLMGSLHGKQRVRLVRACCCPANIGTPIIWRKNLPPRCCQKFGNDLWRNHYKGHRQPNNWKQTKQETLQLAWPIFWQGKLGTQTKQTLYFSSFSMPFSDHTYATLCLWFLKSA